MLSCADTLGLLRNSAVIAAGRLVGFGSAEPCVKRSCQHLQIGVAAPVILLLLGLSKHKDVQRSPSVWLPSSSAYRPIPAVRLPRRFKTHGTCQKRRLLFMPSNLSPAYTYRN